MMLRLGAILFSLFLLPFSVFAAGDELSTQESLTKTVKPAGKLAIGGILTIQVVHDGEVIRTYGPYHNTIVNEGETALRDCFIATSCTDVQNFKYHGIGTSSAAIAETDGGCTTELTTQYNPDSTRATGSQTNNGANVYRTVGTNTVDASATIEEFCLMATSTGAGTMWTRILTGTISLGSGDGLQTTYDLTIE